MAFKFYIDDQLTDAPVNSFDVSTSITRDNTVKGLFITQDVQLVYNNNNNLSSDEISGYAYLNTLFTSGICNEASIEIYDQVNGSETYLLYKGIIKVPDIKVTEQNVNLTTSISDNGYYSYIKNNQNLEVNISATQTKSFQDLTPIDYYTVDLFNSATCAYGSFIGVEYQGYRLIDVFEIIVSAISDNTLGFQSDYLSGLDQEIFLFKGQALINPITVFPLAQDPVIKISFAELFNEIDKLKNLVFFIDESDVNNPILRIENSEYSYDGQLVYTFSDIKDITKSPNNDNLFASVLVGSDNITDGQAAIYTWDSARSYYGWREEQFFPRGQCNIDKELNLVSKFILDNNVIQDTIMFTNSTYIDNIFLIECDNVDDINLTATAYQWEYFGDGGCYYNLGLNNFQKMQRHSVKFETQFGNFLGIGGNGFKALLGADNVDSINYVTAPASAPNFVPPGGVTVNPAEYSNETTDGGYDGGGNYNSVTFEYVVPTDGNYSFLHSLRAVLSGFISNEYFDVYNTITLYDSGLNVKGTNTILLTGTGNGTQIFDNTFVVDAVATDIVKASYQLVYHPNGVGSQNSPRSFYLDYTTFFECNGTPEGGVAITSGNEGVQKYIYEFDYDINETDWRTIKQNITQRFGFEKDGVTRYGWIESMKHNDQTGFTKIKLITNDALITE